MGIKCLLFNPPSLRYFVIAAWAKAIGKSAIFFQNWLRKKKWLNTTQVYFLLTLLTQHWSLNNEGRMELCSMWTSKNPGWQNSLHLEMYHLKQATSTIMIAKEEISGDRCTDVWIPYVTSTHSPLAYSSQWPQSLARGLGRWKIFDERQRSPGYSCSRLYRLVSFIYSITIAVPICVLDAKHTKIKKWLCFLSREFWSNADASLSSWCPAPSRLWLSPLWLDSWLWLLLRSPACSSRLSFLNEISPRLHVTLGRRGLILVLWAISFPDFQPQGCWNE